MRRELKLLLNDAVAIVQGTGSVRFNFDDPAALLHRALRALEDGGGPAWARRRAPQATASEEEARGVLGLAAAHGFALSVLTQSSVRAKLAAGDFERLERLCARIRGPVDASLGELAAAGASVETPQPVEHRRRGQKTAGVAGVAGRRPRGGRGRAARDYRKRRRNPRPRRPCRRRRSCRRRFPPPPCRRRSRPCRSRRSRGAGLAGVRPGRLPNTLAAAEVALTEVPLVGASPVRLPGAAQGRARAKCALLACAPDAHAAAADAIARLSALRDAREAEAAARAAKEEAQAPEALPSTRLAAAGVFLYPEIGAFDAAE